jgi:hypothetical protein
LHCALASEGLHGLISITLEQRLGYQREAGWLQSEEGGSGLEIGRTKLKYETSAMCRARRQKEVVGDQK